MNDLNSKQLNDELNSLASYFSNRELLPGTVIAMLAASCGEIIGRNRQAGVIDDHTAQAMLDTAVENMRYVAFADRSSDGASND